MQELYDWLYRQSPDHLGIPLKATGLVVGLLLVAEHLWALLCAEKSMRILKEFPRSRAWGIGLLAVDTLWSLFLVTHMDMGEFYNWRQWITFIVPVSFLLIVVYVPEFLAVRALGTLLLLVAQPLLEAAFLRQPATRLLLPILAYAWILAGMFMIGMPFLLRDAIDWLTKSSERWKMAALGGAAYGAAMVAAAVFTY